MKFNAKEWEEVEVNENEFAKLVPGGYVAKITSVEDVPDREYLKILYDIAEGDFAGYYDDDYYADKDYAHRFYRSYKESAKSMFKKFYIDLENSNNGYTFDGDEKKMVGKLIGLIIGEEEYKSNDGSIKTKLNVTTTKKVEDVRSGNFKVPALKELAPEEKAETDTFEKVDADIPF